LTTANVWFPDNTAGLAGTVPCIFVEEINEVCRFWPSSVTLDVGTKLLPVITSIVAVPDEIEFGETCVTVGLGLLIVNATAPPDVPPPGGGFVTVTLLMAPAEMLAAGMTAESCVPDTNVVFRVWPLRFAVDGGIKPLPEIATVVSDAPAATELGVTLATAGTGFGAGIGPSPLPVPPPPQPVKDDQMKIAKNSKMHCFLLIRLLSIFLI
jgi:hypothetical protein